MATVSRPPSSPPPPASTGGGGAGAAGRPAGPPPALPRALALGLLALVIAALAYLIFSGSGGTTYNLMFTNVGRLVRGDHVEVGGVPVGTVKNIVLDTHTWEGKVTIEVESSLAPLHRGTTAEIRVPSLSSVAANYVALAPGPNNAPALASGATLSTSSTKPSIELDELFNALNPATRRGLQQLIEGSATQYKGVEKDINAATPYFSPALRATSHIFQELLSDQPTFEAFLVEGARTLGTIAAHSAQFGSLIRNGGRAFGAIGSQAASLEAGLKALPRAIHEGNRAFAQFPSTFAALRHLVNVSKPNTKTLATFFRRLTGLLTEATPVSRQLAGAISKPGPNNDLTDFALALPGLARSLRTGSPDAVKALEQSAPITAFFGPYSPDLIGLFHDFGQQAGSYDANGHFSRVSPNFADFQLREGKLVPVTPTQGLEGLKSEQLTRCPGAAIQPAEDGSSPFTDEGRLGCNPGETP